MKRSDIRPLPSYFDRYILLTEDVDLDKALDQSLQDLENIDISRLEAVGDQVYAPGKWAIADILQHIIDTERIFDYRALRFARNDGTPLPGYDQDKYAAEAGAAKRTVDELLNELKAVRKTSILFFASLDDTELLRKGICYEREMSVLAIGFTIAGHQQHHLQIIREKYLSLVENDK